MDNIKSTKVKIADNYFKAECYRKYNGATGKLAGSEGTSGKTYAVDMNDGGRIFIEPEHLVTIV